MAHGPGTGAIDGHDGDGGGSTDLSASSPVARVMRFVDGVWRPVGDPLPPFAHAPPDPGSVIAPWVLPREPAPAAGDVLVIGELVIGELAHQLVSRCERDDPLFAELAEQTMILWSHEDAMAWLAEIELWVGRRLEPGRSWPTAAPG